MIMQKKASTPIPLLRRTKMLALFSNRSYVIHLLLVTVATLTLGLVSTIHAQETTYDASFSSNVKEAVSINVLVGQSRVINFDWPIGRFLSPTRISPKPSWSVPTRCS